VFFQGAQFGKSPVVSAAVARNGFRVITGTQYPMSNALTGDAAAANAITEDASIAAATYQSHAAAQDTNYMQIWYRQYAISYARQTLNENISGVAATGEPLAQVGSLQVQRQAHLMQLMADIEFSCLYGTAQAWTNAATTGATGGLLKAVQDGSETAAAGATLSKTLIATETARMAAAGAEFIDMAVVGNAHQIQVLNDLYGFAEQSRTVGGVSLDTVLIPLLGRCTVMYDPIAATDDLGFIDLAHFQVCIGAKPGMDAGVVVEPVGKIAAGEYEQIWAMFGVDYHDIIYHGMLSGMATS
jgi:hypothetical protein